MLLELCIIELEDFALNNNTLLALPQPVIQESAHPYSNQITTNGVIRIPGRFITYSNESNINKSFFLYLLYFLIQALIHYKSSSIVVAVPKRIETL